MFQCRASSQGSSTMPPPSNIPDPFVGTQIGPTRCLMYIAWPPHLICGQYPVSRLPSFAPACVFMPCWPTLPDYVRGHPCSSGIQKYFNYPGDLGHPDPSLHDPSSTHLGLSHVLQSTSAHRPLSRAVIHPPRHFLAANIWCSLMWAWEDMWGGGVDSQWPLPHGQKPAGQLMGRFFASVC